MFKRLFKNKNRSQGYSVKILGYGPLLYTEGHRTLEIPAEVYDKWKKIGITFTLINKWDNTNELINEEEKERIIDNVIRYLKEQRFEIKID